MPGFPRRRFRLGVFGYAINALALLWVVFTIIFFLFPPDVPTTALTMNYAVVSSFCRSRASCGTPWRVRRAFTLALVLADTISVMQCVIFLILAVSGVMWLAQGKRNYSGPKDIEGLLALARHGVQKGELLEGRHRAASRVGDGDIEVKAEGY